MQVVITTNNSIQNVVVKLSASNLRALVEGQAEAASTPYPDSTSLQWRDPVDGVMLTVLLEPDDTHYAARRGESATASWALSTAGVARVGASGP